MNCKNTRFFISTFSGFLEAHEAQHYLDMGGLLKERTGLSTSFLTSDYLKYYHYHYFTPLLVIFQSDNSGFR